MNIVITLPPHLVEAFIRGEKTAELRKSYPLHLKTGEDGFFIVTKGTQFVSCWCRVSEIKRLNKCYTLTEEEKQSLFVDDFWIEKYRRGHKPCYMWKTDKIKCFSPSIKLNELIVDRAPQQFAYCPLSYGESY